VTISRAVPNIKSERPAETRDFFVELLGFEVAMDVGWVVTVASPTNPSVQVTIIGNDDMAAPGVSVGVADAARFRQEEKRAKASRELLTPQVPSAGHAERSLRHSGAVDICSS
jgi:hypothetical protein